MTNLTIEGLTKDYGPFRAVDDVSLTLNSGEFLSLLGPSGCGKTTTLRMIAGFITPSAGRIILDGDVISSPEGSLPPEKREMSMIFQSYAIWPNMTVAQNVGFGLRMKRLPSEEIRKRTGEILEVVRLSALADRYPNELSGGQQQRVALARAVVVQPKVMLLDEPLSNLDANLREEMRNEIRRMHDEFKVTTVYVTHDQAEAMAISDRIAVVNSGRIEQVETPYKLYTRPKTRFAAEFIGRTNLIDGCVEGGMAKFDGFELPMDQLACQTSGSELLVSLRPQSIRLQSGEIGMGGTDDLVLSGVITERCFLGESWDYTCRLKNSGLELRVAASAEHVFEMDQPAKMIIPTGSIIPVQAEIGG